MLAKINAWYSQSSNQIALGALVTAVGSYLAKQLTLGGLLSVVIGFVTVAVKNQSQATVVTTTPAVTR